MQILHRMAAALPLLQNRAMNKRELSETEICDRFITPALQRAGWLLERIRREYSFTDGRIIVRGRLVHRGKRRRAAAGPRHGGSWRRCRSDTRTTA
jgi:hypothetical protein